MRYLSVLLMLLFSMNAALASPGINFAAVPEPETFALLAIGAVGMLVAKRKK